LHLHLDVTAGFGSAIRIARPPHPHSRLTPVRELDAGGFKGGADGGKLIDGRHA
jgi:hypothetical protein